MLYKDTDIKSCSERRDKTPSGSRRPVPEHCVCSVRYATD